jgi:hypothetical protein
MTEPARPSTPPPRPAGRRDGMALAAIGAALLGIVLALTPATSGFAIALGGVGILCGLLGLCRFGRALAVAGLGLSLIVTGAGIFGRTLFVDAIANFGNRAEAPVTAPAGRQGDGTFLMNTHISPGFYRVTGTLPGPCHWQRVRALTGSTDSVIKEGYASENAAVEIRLASSDLALRLSGCRPLVKVDN